MILPACETSARSSALQPLMMVSFRALRVWATHGRIALFVRAAPASYGALVPFTADPA